MDKAKPGNPELSKTWKVGHQLAREAGKPASGDPRHDMLSFMRLLEKLSSRPGLRALAIAAILIDAVVLYFGLHLETFDARLYFPPENVGWILASMTNDGRRLYVSLLFLDFALIGTYTALFLGLWQAKGRKFSALWALLPGAADLIETASALVLTVAFPTTVPPLETVLSAATPAKWTLLVFFLFRIIRA